MSEQYTYAVARVRAKELTLLNRVDIDQILACKTYDDARNVLNDKGFGDGENFATLEELLEYEREKMWKFIHELVGEESEFEIFLYKNDFHNLKAAIKSQLTGSHTQGLFSNNGTVPPEDIRAAIKSRDYTSLPMHLKGVAEEAVDVLLKTGDGQECDIIIDKATMLAIRDEGRKSKVSMIDKYTELIVALADIKIAVRCAKTDKSIHFIKRALAECDTLNIESLAVASSKSLDDLYKYLENTIYSPVIAELEHSMSAFEKWCDDRIMSLIRVQKTNSFTIAPIIAYMLARENEIKAVQIVMTGKLHDINDKLIKERVRDLYV
ncbi:MAG: V-type ATPase subunit [Oscillospiraceae bacterium]